MPPGVSENSPAAAVDRILAPSSLAHLGRLRLNVRRAFGARPGNTPVRNLVQPTGLELERHKAYDQGDELRFLDWNAYARLDQLLVRQFRAERETPVHILLDGSASMDVPERDGKFAFAVGLALALAYVGVRHHNPVRIALIRSRAAGALASPTVRFPARMPLLAEFCARLRCGEGGGFDEGVAEYSQSLPQAGFVVLLSDFLAEPADTRVLLHRLASRDHEIAVLRPLGAAERDPSLLFQRARVRDVETGGEKVVRLTPHNLGLYRRALEEHLTGLERDCLDNEALFGVCDIAAGLENCLFAYLPRIGLLR